MTVTSFEVLKKRILKDPEVKAAYDAMEPEFALAAEFIRARARVKMTQADVAKRMKTTQSVVARIESGRSSVSMSSIQRYADAVGAKLVLKLEPVRTPRKRKPTAQASITR